MNLTTPHKLLFAPILAWLGLASQAHAADYFAGRTITVVIPTSPGGGRAANATPFLDRYAEHIPGHPRIIPQFMPGAGGSVGLNYLFNVAPRDGAVIATPLAGAIIAQATGDKSVQYDASKMAWIGRTSDSTQVLYVRSASSIKDIGDAKIKTVSIGSDGVSSASTIIPLIMNATIGTRFRVIQGYDGSAAFNLAVQRGETDGALTTWSNLETSHKDWLRDGVIRILFQVSSTRNPEIGGAPLAVDLVQNRTDRDLIDLMDSPADIGESFISAPGVPASVIEILRRAFDDTIQDPVYRATTRNLGIALNPLTGAQLDALTAKTLAVPASAIAKYREAIAAAR